MPIRLKNMTRMIPPISPSLSGALSEGTLFFLRNKLVADSVNGPKKNGAIRIALDLPSQFRNAIVHSAETGALPLWPDGIDQLLARDDDLWSGNQELENFEFLESYVNRLIGATELHFSEIQRDLTELRDLTNSRSL